MKQDKNYWFPKNKANFLQMFGLTSYLWSNNHSAGMMAERMGLTWDNWLAINEWADKNNIQTTYSENCNAGDYFKEVIKEDEENNFEYYWKLVKEGNTEFKFSDRHHSLIFLFK